MFAQIPALIQRAVQHFQQGELTPAAQLLRQVLDAQPRNFDALHILGVIQAMGGHRSEAIELFRKALSVHKNNNFLQFNLAKALSENGQDEEALLHHRKATQLAPDHAEAWLNYGKSLMNLAQLADALTAFDKALEINPAYAEALNNKGLVLADIGRVEEAMACLRQAIALQPQLQDSHWNLALQQLKLGLFAEAWDGFEYRWKIPDALPPKLISTKPLWSGINSDKPLMLWGEQGIGDQLLYSSLLPELVDLPQRKMVALDRRLIPLFQRSLPGFEYLDLEQVSDALDFAEQLPLGSLPRLLRPSRESFSAAHHPFLKADTARSAELRQKIERPGQRTIGVSWSSSRKSVGRQKSIRLEQMLLPLAGVQLNFVDLQYGDTTAERTALEHEHGIQVQHLDDIDNFHDIDGLAALIQACDIVITTSNSTAHLAGALGKETLLLLPLGKGKLWYWTEVDGKNPWYPSVRSFSQTAPGDWQQPLEQVKRYLEDKSWN